MVVTRVLVACFLLPLAAVPAQSQLASTGSGQAFPGRTIRIIVGFASGGATDLTARVLAPKMSEALGQLAVVENRPAMPSFFSSCGFNF